MPNSTVVPSFDSHVKLSDEHGVEIDDILGRLQDHRERSISQSRSASLQRAATSAASIAMTSFPTSSTFSPPLDKLIELETGIEAAKADYPKVDSKASCKMAAWAGVPVELKPFYRPFLASVVAESKDELKALRDIAYVQEQLHRAHLKHSTWQRKEAFLKSEVAAVQICPEDKTESEKCKQAHF